MSMDYERDEKGNITRAASVVGLSTLLSRVLGYIRDAVIAFGFGAGLYADCFFVAFRVSNLLRRLVGEGALTSSFVPIFTEELNRRSRIEAARLVSKAFTTFFVILVLLALLGIVFSDYLIMILSPGFAEVPGKFSLTVKLTRVMFPYMVFIGLMALAMGVLNSLRHFLAPALSPVLFNISIILAAVLLAPLMKVPVYALAAGVLLGGVMQFVLQLPYLKRYGMAPGVDFGFTDPAIKRIFILMGPALLGVGVYQLNIFVTMRFASRLAEGSVSYLYYASRLMELPLGVFAVALSTAVLPSLSEYVAKRDFDSFRESLSFALRSVNFVTIPATFGLLVLSLPIIDILFVRGEFGAEDAMATAFALYFYALGLVPVASSRILVSVFYSLKDTTTPVLVGLVTVLFNIIMCIILVGPLKHGGLALATSLASTLNLVCLLAVLRRRFGRFEGKTVVRSALKSTLASAVMAIAVYGFVILTGWDGLGTGLKIVIIVTVITTGIFVYLAGCRALKVPELLFLKGIVGKGREVKREENGLNE
jgi:putative peptidoglycan lipid II flippase